MEALANGESDVAADYLDLLPAFEGPARQRGARVRALPFYQAGMDVYGSGLVAGVDVIRRRAQVLVALVAAVREALATTRVHPEAGFPALRASFAEAERERALTGWRAGEPLIFGDDSELGVMAPDKWVRTIEHHARTHGTPLLDPMSVFVDVTTPGSAACEEGVTEPETGSTRTGA